MNYNKNHVKTNQNINDYSILDLLSSRHFWFIVLTTLIIITLFYYKINQAFYVTNTNCNVHTSINPITSRINGKIKLIHVENEQYVHAGDLLIEFEHSDYAQKLITAQTNLFLAKEKLDLAKFKKDRAYKLYHNNTISFKDYNDNISTYNLDLAKYNEANLAVTAAELALNNTKIIAPYDSWVTNLSLNNAALIKTNEKLLELVKDENFWLEVNLNKKQLNNIKTGQKVSIKIKDFPNYPFEGIVEKKSTLKILITNNKFHFPLRNNMKAKVKIAISNPIINFNQK